MIFRAEFQPKPYRFIDIAQLVKLKLSPAAFDFTPLVNKVIWHARESTILSNKVQIHASVETSLTGKGGHIRELQI